MTQQETRDRIVGRMRGVIRCIKDGQYIEGAIIDGLYEVGVEIADEIIKLRDELETMRDKATAWDARQQYILEPGDDDPTYESWENAEFNLRMAEKNKTIAELRERIAALEAWTPMSTAPDEIDVPYLVATLDGRVAERVWCRDWMGSAPEFYLRDEDSIGRGEIAYWRKIVPPVPTPMEGR